MTLISLFCDRCGGDSHERDHAYKCRPMEPAMTTRPTVEPAGVSEQRLPIRWRLCTGPHALYAIAVTQFVYCRDPNVEFVEAQFYELLEAERNKERDELLAARQQLADLRSRNADLDKYLEQAQFRELALKHQLAEMRGALENWSNCVECGARRFDADVALAPTSQPSRGKCVCECEMCFGTDCAQPERQGAKCDHTGCVVNTHTGSLTGECTRCGETFALPTLAQFTSPPPTDDIVARFLIIELQVLRDHLLGGACDQEKAAATVDRAIAALGEKGCEREAVIQECWDAINSWIKTGPLPTTYETEQRNGMVLATNVLMGMMMGVPAPPVAGSK